MKNILPGMLPALLLAAMLVSCSAPQQTLPYPQRLPVDILFVQLATLPVEIDSVLNL